MFIPASRRAPIVSTLLTFGPIQSYIKSIGVVGYTKTLINKPIVAMIEVFLRKCLSSVGSGPVPKLDNQAIFESAIFRIFV